MPKTFAEEGRSEPSRDSVDDLTHVIGRRGVEITADPEPRRGRNAPLPKIEGYEILGELGRGGMGVVYKARQTLLNRVVALKMILGGGLANDELLRRFEREATSVARLQHPTIVQIFEVGVQRSATGDGFSCPFISLEFVEGGSLAQKLGSRPQPAREAARFVETLARAVHYAHERGIIHRDLKPANVLLTADGAPKLTDFGLAKDVYRFAADAKTVSGLVMGTPEYMAPEQAAGRGNIGIAADVYGLGGILYEMLTGRRPFEGENELELLERVMREPPRSLRRLRPDLPRDIEVACLKCLEKEPSRRYRNAAALADDLARFQADEPIQARPPGPVGRFARWCRRKPLVAGMTTALVTMFVLGFVAVTALWLLAAARGRLAEKKSEEARNALAGEAQARSDGQLHIAHLDGATAGRLLDDGDLLASLPWLVEMMQLEEQGLANQPEEKAARERLHRARLAAVLRQCPRPLQIWTHDRPLRAAFFSSDGRHVFTAAEREAVRLWDTESGVLKLELPPGANDAARLALATNGRLAACPGPETNVAVTDTPRGSPIGDMMIFPEKVSHLALSPDGTRLLVTYGNRAQLWVVGQTKKLWDEEPRRGEKSGLAVAAFVAGGRRVVVAGMGEEPELRDANSGVVLARLRCPKPGAVCSSPDNRHLAICGADGVRVFESEAGKELRFLAHGAAVQHAAFSPDGKLLATAGDDGSARVWDVEAGDMPLATVRHAGRVVRVAFSPDGRRLLTASHDGTARLWHASTGRALLPPLRHSRPLVTAGFHPDGDRVLTAAEDGVARLWDVTEASHPARLLRHGAPVTSAAFDGDGTRAATAARDGTVRLWTTSGAPASPWLRQAERLLHVGFHPNGRGLITAGYLPLTQPLGVVQTWDIARAAPSDLRLTIGAGPVKRAAYNPDGSRVLLTAPFSANVWDRSLRRDAVSINHGAKLLCAVFSADGSRVGVGSEGGFGVWDASAGELCRVPQRDVNHVAFSPDGERLALAEMLHSARIVSARTGAQVIPPMPHDDQVRCVAFSPNGRALVSAGDDRTARLWDAETGQVLTLPLQHRGPVVSAMFAADGKRVLTICNIATDAGTEGQARWWDVATGEPLTPPLIHPGEVYQGVCSRDGAVVTACQNGAAWVWPAAEPINWALDDLRELAEISAGQRLDARRGPVPLAPAEFSRIWKHVRSQRPAHFERSAARVEDWRRYEVEECAAAGLWSAAAWFLDRLRADRPMDWEVAAWRAHVDLASGAAGPAEDKLTAALKLGPPDAVRAWLKSRADLAAAGEHWPTARWYLDHMVLQRPGDAASYAERAVVRGRMGDAAGRIADLEKAVELGAGGGVVAQLAQVHAGADDWRQAASLYAAAVKRGVPAWAESALASLKAMDREGYQKACAMALAQASAGDPGPQQMNQAAWLFALAPGATADYSAVIKQATAAVAATPPADRHNYLNTLGALLYRAGRDREAIDRLREGIKLSRGGAVAEDWIFLGLAHLHLGEADEAKRCLERFHNVPAPPRDTFSWQRIEYDLLREQFESALAESPSNLKK